MQQDEVRGTARILIGFMLTIGIVVDIFLTNKPVFFSIESIIIFIIGILFIVWGSIATNNSIKKVDTYEQ